MKKSMFVLLLVIIGTAGCSYIDYERPVIRNYPRDLWGPPERPAEDAERPPTGAEALARAFALWQKSIGPAREEYQVGPGDVLKVSILVRPQLVEDMTFELAVSREGQIHCPLIGAIEVAGLSTIKVSEKLSKLYGEAHYRNPTVITTATEFASKRVVVTGAVMKPGVLVLKTNRTTLIEVLLESGGLAKEAGAKASITRAAPASGEKPAEPETLAADLERLTKEMDLVQNLAVLPGDVVHVPPAEPKVFYVLGYVSRQGMFPFPKNASLGVMDAIAIAGGITPRARPEYTYLVRETPAGRRYYHVDLHSVAYGSRPDIPIRPNDRIIVSTTGFIRLLDGIFVGSGLSGVIGAATGP